MEKLYLLRVINIFSRKARRGVLEKYVEGAKQPRTQREDMFIARQNKK